MERVKAREGGINEGRKINRERSRRKYRKKKGWEGNAKTGTNGP